MKTSRISASLAFSICFAAAVPAAWGANVISFNAIGAASGGMGASETAGAPGASVSNWNNMNSVQTTGGGAITGSLGAGAIVDGAGVTLATTSLAWAGTGVASAVGGGTDSQKMFESEWDLFDSASNTAVSDMIFTVSNIPYALYDVYFYVQDASNAATRGGNVTANGITKSITMFNFPGDNPDGPYGYVEADSAFSWNAATTERGTYLRIGNLTGDLTLDISSQNPSTPRLRMSGFQIVQVPEPSSAMLVLGSLAALIMLPRRR